MNCHWTRRLPNLFETKGNAMKKNKIHIRNTLQIRQPLSKFLHQHYHVWFAIDETQSELLSQFEQS